jgi:FkbM family methyltransferase
MLVFFNFYIYNYIYIVNKGGIMEYFLLIIVIILFILVIVMFKFNVNQFRNIRNYIHKNHTNTLLTTTKLSMLDNIYYLNNGIKFYLPFFPMDFISKRIVATNNFFEIEDLTTLKEYIPEQAVILDIGANIGNHSMYWSLKNNASMIYSFEPQEHIFNILQKNIEINNIKNIKAFNIALGKHSTKGAYTAGNYNHGGMGNFGGQEIIENEQGSVVIKSLDDVLSGENISKIDFIKCDVEGFEFNVLLGAEHTLIKYKPLIFIEVFANNKEKVFAYLSSLGYINIKTFDLHNYLFKNNSI